MASSATTAPPERAEFYRRLEREHLAPLWEVLAKLVPREPASPCHPALWPYATLRPLLLEAGRLITAQQAERRVLVLENPGLRGNSCITHTLYAGLQLILPGEIAPSHRHTQSALRFVVEGTGAYTAVDGERTTMHPGDFIVTPSWTFHDHGNPGDAPVIWLDGLDIPMVSFFDAGFAERHPEESQPVTKPEGDALARYGANLLPLEHAPASSTTPLLSYPYGPARAALERLRHGGKLDPRHGVKMQYVNPATGGYPMPTIAAFLQLLPQGFRGQGYRSTDGTVFSVVEGHGRTHVGDQAFDWSPKDVFVVPSWGRVRHEAEEDAVLFSFSDRPAQKALGLWREEVEA
ncbi:MAG TPA: gentisate 1,2-dioxygenase [Polyangiaceae bacterium]|jgi:gentisate 1,2-dioxygenase|nr:gentisate 1,2-dioxygenase [Polyangiaceae bacterium]